MWRYFRGTHAELVFRWVECQPHVALFLDIFVDIHLTVLDYISNIFCIVPFLFGAVNSRLKITRPMFKVYIKRFLR